ncbi:hypothetical protein O998_02615 [Anaplasma phagocytophilum str. Norway variant1]|uniref:Uncharacterized protein n=1 Tax=Anaplasma phagocytophilum str. Norway variant1 TaxID=1392506 RepID=A0A7H9DZW6_ANAPH|nr:hypothetical protein [Anaplasma phagocytophilum]QLL66709.1 hypothetical protein O998_02615 [Anaplasma phagocytophilum str. Norway variant1]
MEDDFVLIICICLVRRLRLLCGGVGAIISAIFLYIAYVFQFTTRTFRFALPSEATIALLEILAFENARVASVDEAAIEYTRPDVAARPQGRVVSI